MNKRKIISIIGKIILIEAILMIPALLVAFIYGDGDASAFLCTIIPALIIGLIMSRVKQSEKRMSSRDGYFIVAAAWIIVSLIGALPLYIGGDFHSYIDALFEIVSGFTTTGASILSETGRVRTWCHFLEKLYPLDWGHGSIGICAYGNAYGK